VPCGGKYGVWVSHMCGSVCDMSVYSMCSCGVCDVCEVCGVVCVCSMSVWWVSVMCCVVGGYWVCCTVWCVYVMCAVSLSLHVVCGM
jgi:hypothetical protein